MKAYKGGNSSGNNSDIDPNLMKVIKQIEKKEGKKVIPNESAMKYSAMLLDLIRPYHSALPDIEDMEELLELATIAWNMANMKKIIPHAYTVMLRETKKDFGEDKKSIQLLEKLIKEKTNKYGQHEMFIHQADVNITPKGQFFVTATAKSIDSFLEDSFMNEEEQDKLNYMPGFVNRNAFTVLPKKPFLDWLKNVEGNSLFPLETIDNNIYLIEEKDSNEEIEVWLKKNFDIVFRKELEVWFAAEKLWPKNRTYQMFRDWFDISYQSMVYDLEDYPLNKDIT